MKLLLIDQNPIIQKLVSLSAQKSNIEVELINSLAESPKSELYEFIFVDDEVYDEALFEELKQKVKSGLFTLIIGKNREKTPGFDTYIQKPFLPTELVDFFSEQKQKDLSIFEEKSSGIKDIGVGGFDAFEHDDEHLSLSLDSKDDFPMLGIEDDGLLKDEPLLDGFGELGELDIGSGTDELEGLEDLGQVSIDSDADEEYGSKIEEHEDISLSPNMDDISSDSFGEIDGLGSLDGDSELEDMDISDLTHIEPEMPDIEFDKNNEMVEMGEIDFDSIDEPMALQEESISVAPEPTDSEDSFDEADFGSFDAEMQELSKDTPEGEESHQEMDELDMSEFDTKDLDEQFGIGGGILDKEDINEVKGLLDDAGDDGFEGIREQHLEEETSDGDESMHDMKIENSELASLTEEALSEALGESSIGDIGDSDEFASLGEMPDELDIGGADDLIDISDEIEGAVEESADELPIIDTASFSKSPAPHKDESKDISAIASAINLMDTDKLRKVLDGLQITIQLSYTK